MSRDSRPIYYQLFSVAGVPYEGVIEANAVLLSPDCLIFQFRNKVKNDNSNALSFADARRLKVYQNKSAFENRNRNDGNVYHLKSSHPLTGLGQTEDEALIVVVPSRNISTPWFSPSNLVQIFNDITEGNPRKRACTDTATINWDEVQSVFKPLDYVQPGKEIDDDSIDFLLKYLSYARKSLGKLAFCEDVKRLHFIAPVLICVTNLLNGAVDMAVDVKLEGNYVKANGQFEFMLRRGKKAVCVVEAKKGDIEQGMIQGLIGLEVAAELGGLDTVYGIVTNYIQWNFIRSLNDKIEVEECVLNLNSGVPERESLKSISEKIYAMLSD